MMLEQELEAFIREERLCTGKEKLLLAISGGLDSVVLAALLRVRRQPVEWAHVNFQLRGDESLRDEQFVRELAGKWGIVLHVQHLDAAAFAAAEGCSVQEAARKLRYEWFETLRQERGLDAICTAHHADDNVETMLMNLFRGTGMAGLRGILPKQGKILRPLLFASRAALEAYAREHRLEYVDDSSNATEKYTRNYFRHSVLPLIRKIYPEAEENLRQNLPRFRESQQLYREAVDRKLKKLIVQKEKEWHVPAAALAAAQPLHTIVFELFHPFGFRPAQTPAILSLLPAQTGSYVDSATHRILKNRKWLIITPLAPVHSGVQVITASDTHVELANGTLHLQQQSWQEGQTVDPDPLVAQLDLREISFPLIIRPWKPGDYFYPLGLKKKKKVARLLIDLKIPRHEKEKVRVLESAGRICWVVGVRIDDRFRIRSSTQNVLKISWKKHSV